MNLLIIAPTSIRGKAGSQLDYPPRAVRWQPLLASARMRGTDRSPMATRLGIQIRNDKRPLAGAWKEGRLGSGSNINPDMSRSRKQRGCPQTVFHAVGLEGPTDCHKTHRESVRQALS